MKRELMLEMLENGGSWDIIVIGGGASGLGTAVDAASRGYKTLLVEQSDFAKGTSSRSTKLIHGGLRYLKQGNIPLVREALKERKLLFHNAPHLIHPISFVIPCYRAWEQSYYFLGLKLYDLLAGNFKHASSKHLTYQQTLAEVPTIQTEGLKGSALYYDGQFDDARLAVTLAQTLAGLNGTVLNYVIAKGLLKTHGKISGILAQDLESGKEYELHSRVVVNATGTFCDAIRLMDEPQAFPLIQPSRGTHVVLPRSFLPGNSALMIPTTEDGRVLFLIPWHNRVLAGTTETPVNEPSLEPQASQEEISFILEHASKYLSVKPGTKNILSIFSGLRPLVKPKSNKKSAAISREHTILASPSGLITVAGGKWTTYRKMGEDTVNMCMTVGKLPRRSCLTYHLPLHGCVPFVKTLGTMNCYGADAPQLETLIQDNPELDQPIHPSLPYLKAEVIWGVRTEMARTLEDILARRTRSLLLDARSSIEAAPHVAQLMAKELGKDSRWIEEQLKAYRELASHYEYNK